MQGVQIRSLVGELRSRRLWDRHGQKNIHIYDYISSPTLQLNHSLSVAVKMHTAVHFGLGHWPDFCTCEHGAQRTRLRKSWLLWDCLVASWYVWYPWFPCPAGSRDGSMGLWEVTDDVLTKSDARHNVSRVPVYSHITHKALKDIPKEDTNPDNCKVRALAFNNKNKVWACQRSLKPIPLASVSWLMSWKMHFPSLLPSQSLLHNSVLSPSGISWRLRDAQ